MGCPPYFRVDGELLLVTGSELRAPPSISQLERAVEIIFALRRCFTQSLAAIDPISSKLLFTSLGAVVRDEIDPSKVIPFHK